MRRFWPVLFIIVGLFGWSVSALAARQYTITQITPTPPGQFDMGTTQSVTFRITNTASGGNSTERIYEMRFRISSGTLFSTTTAAPAGWTRTAFSTTSVTFTASSWANAIVSGSSVDFTLVINTRTTTADVTERLQDARAGFTLDTNFSNGIARTGRVTINNPGSWQLKSLQITSFQTTDTSGVATGSVAAGQSFRLVIQVKNISSATQSGIVANAAPAVTTRTGTWFGTSPNCSLTGTNPSPLNLAPGASGTITYTCTTHVSPPSPTDSGTVTYTVTYVRNSTGTATSRSATSNTLLVSPLSVSISIAGPYADTTCHFSGDTATFAMTVVNNTAGVLTTITPSALTFTGTNATVGTFSGPAPASCSSVAVSGSCTFTWTAPVTIVGSYPLTGAKPSFYVTGFATATPGPITSPVATSLTTQDVDGFIVTASPSATNAQSTNQEITWNVTNRGCDNVDKVAITVPAGFTFAADGHSLVNDTTGTPNETWTLSSTTFTAPLNNAPAADPGRLAIDRDGDFSLVFSATPSTPGTYTFTLRLTDENGVFRDRTTDVTVSPFGTGTINSTTPSTWREAFQ